MTAYELSLLIRKRVEDGTYSSRIPSTHNLAEGFGVGRDTAWRAVNILRKEGLLICTGRKFYVKTGITRRDCADTRDSLAPASVTPISSDDLRKSIGQPDAQFMTTDEFAAFMRVGKMTVLRMIHSGELYAIKMSERCFRIPIDSAVKYLNSASS